MYRILTVHLVQLPEQHYKINGDQSTSSVIVKAAYQYDYSSQFTITVFSSSFDFPPLMDDIGNVLSALVNENNNSVPNMRLHNI